MKKIKTKLLSVVLATSLLLPGTSAYASTYTVKTSYDRTKLISETTQAAELFQKAVEMCLAEEKENLKTTIVDEGYDYYLTLESFDNQDNPYNGYDYNKLLLAYATAKEKATKNENIVLYQLPLVKTEITRAEVSMKVPVLVQYYEETEKEGYYRKSYVEYVEKEMEYPNYVPDGENGYYIDGTTTIVPQTEKVVYGDVKLSPMTSDDIFSFYGVSEDKESSAALSDKITEMASIINGYGLGQMVNIEFPFNYKEEDWQVELVTRLLESGDLTEEKSNVIKAGEFLIGKVPYDWGGKSTKSGYDTSWWTIKADGKQKGLDCSGFVQWCFRTAGVNHWRYMASTGEILRSCKTIDRSELKPGDLGLLNNGNAINHVGIYMGDGYWMHCSSAAKTVTINQTNMFTIFKAFPEGSGVDVNELDEAILTRASGATEYSEEDIYLVAQTVYHEAYTEGLNGWVGVAEVIRNRIESPLFPDTAYDVIYAPGQFAYNNEIQDMQPPEELITVVRYVLGHEMEYFSNSNVLYFRNAKGDTSDWGEFPYYTTINNHQFYTQN